MKQDATGRTARLINRAMIAGVTSALLLMTTWVADARADSAEAPSTETNAPVIVPPCELWFPVGEELVYDVYWGFIPVGQSKITTAWVIEEGRTLLKIRYRTRSNKVIATLYPVDDVIEALIDPITFLPVKFAKNLKEGRTRYNEETTFDHENLKAHWRSLLSEKKKDFDIEPDTRDLVTFMYYMRSADFRKGEKKQYRVMADEKIYDLYLNVKDTEKIKLDGFGKVRSMRIEPEAMFNGLFVRKGKMTIWVSQDKRRLCTQMKAAVPVASIRVVLAKVRGPGDDLWVKRSPDKSKGDED